MPEVRALPSPGITRLQRYYDPVRLPPGPPPETASKLRTPTGRVSPDYPHCPSNVPCLIPRWTERVLASISSPPARPSPNLRRVGVHDFTFEACSGFTRVTARWIAQPPESGLCHEASARPVAQPDRSSATRSIDNFLGGTFLHWQHAPSGRTEISGLATYCAGQFLPRSVALWAMRARARNPLPPTHRSTRSNPLPRS
jgi:hypothetical protein